MTTKKGRRDRWTKGEKVRLRSLWGALYAQGHGTTSIARHVALAMGRTEVAVLKMASQLWLPTTGVRNRARPPASHPWRTTYRVKQEALP